MQSADSMIWFYDIINFAVISRVFKVREILLGLFMAIITLS